MRSPLISFSMTVGWGNRPIPFALPGAPGRQAGDDYRQFSRLDRFGDVHLETRLERAQSVFAPPVGRQRDGRNLIRRGALLGFQRAHFLEYGVAILVRHSDVQNQRVGPLAARRVGEKRQRLRSRRHGCHLRAVFAERLGQNPRASS